MSILTEALDKLNLIRESTTDETEDDERKYILPEDVSSYSCQKEESLVYKFVSGDHSFVVELDPTGCGENLLEDSSVRVVNDYQTFKIAKEFGPLIVIEINGEEEDCADFELRGNCEYYIKLDWTDEPTGGHGDYITYSWGYAFDEVKLVDCSFALAVAEWLDYPNPSPYTEYRKTIAAVLNNEIKKGNSSEFYKELFQIVKSCSEEEIRDGEIEIKNDYY